MSRRIVRLGETDTDRTIKLFELMAEVFEEPAAVLDRDYVAAMLANPSFWAYAVLMDDDVLGGSHRPCRAHDTLHGQRTHDLRFCGG